MMKDRETSLGGLGGAFPSPHWSFVLSSPDRSTPDCLDRMNTLVSQYWKPVYRTIRLGWRKNNEDAKDLTQAFLADLLERKFWLAVELGELTLNKFDIARRDASCGGWRGSPNPYN